MFGQCPACGRGINVEKQPDGSLRCAYCDPYMVHYLEWIRSMPVDDKRAIYAMGRSVRAYEMAKAYRAWLTTHHPETLFVGMGVNARV